MEKTNLLRLRDKNKSGEYKEPIAGKKKGKNHRGLNNLACLAHNQELFR
jgi:hypothetical protein